MYKFKILSSDLDDDFLTHFEASSVQSALDIFYVFCAERLSVDDVCTKYFLVLLNDSGIALCTVALYRDFVRYISNLVKIAGGI